jgi:non-heme Fe2+,alpha-ketoglutarate-dependent halogenase
LPQRETYALDNALSRGQEITIEVDGSKAIPLTLSPGEMSLHHIGIAHSSKANAANYARIGFAVRYIAPEVVQQGSVRQIVQLVRGKDEHGNFEIVEPPDDAETATEIRREADRRVLKNVYPEGQPK